MLLKADLFSQERQRRYLSLSPWDKATLSLVRLKLTFRCLLDPRRRPASSSCLCLSGSCDSFQQDGEDCRVLLHPVPALLGVPGTWAGVWRCIVSPQSHLWSRFRCYTRLRGARASAETAPRSVLKSESLYPRTRFSSFCRLGKFPILWFLFPPGTPTTSTSSTRTTQTSKPVAHPGERRLVWMLACPAEEI